MCMICVDEAVAGAGILLAASPWYRSAWKKICKFCRQKAWELK